MKSNHVCPPSQKGKTKKNKSKERIFWIFATNLITIMPIHSTIQKHTFTSFGSTQSNEIEGRVCVTSTETVITSTWFKENTAVSFNTQGSITATQFIPDDNNIKQYSMLERGSDNCYMRSSSYTGWIFVALVIEKHPTTANTCYVSRIITTSHLETCSGSPPSLETLLSFSSGTYDSVPKDARLIFDWNTLPPGVRNIWKYTLPSSFTFSSLDEDFMELLLLKHQSRKSKILQRTIRIDNMEDMRRGYFQKKGGITFTAGDLVKKNIVDGLRGFHLNPDPADPFGTYKEKPYSPTPWI